MRHFEIVDGSKRNAAPCAILSWDEDADALAIRLADGIAACDCPMMLAPFARKGEWDIPEDWVRRWVEDRVPPSGRQNIGQVLKANGLQFYDPMKLLVAGEGRCAQDDFFIREITVNGEDLFTETIGEPVRVEYATWVPSHPASAQIAASIVAARKEQGLSQLELARRCGLRQSAISRLESGKSNPTLGTLEDVAKALGKSLEAHLR